MSNPKWVSEHRRRRKIMAIKYKGGKCENCGYSRCVAALEFHHRDASTKDVTKTNHGSLNLGISWTRLIEELDKCSLLCSNCHREVESDRRINMRSDDCRDDKASKPMMGTVVRKANPGKHSMGMDNSDHQASKPMQGTTMRSRSLMKHEKGNVSSPMQGTTTRSK